MGGSSVPNARAKQRGAACKLPGRDSLPALAVRIAALGPGVVVRHSALGLHVARAWLHRSRARFGPQPVKASVLSLSISGARARWHNACNAGLFLDSGGLLPNEVDSMDIFVQQIINGLVLGSMYALVALGYTMVYGIISLINFAHGEILMVGAMVSWTVVTALADSGIPGWGLLLISLLCAIVVCSALNFAVEKIAYRPLRNAPRLAPLITAMGMSLLLQTLAMILWKPNPKSYPPLLPTDVLFLWVDGPVITIAQILILATTVIVLASLLWLVNKTKLGRAMRATAENPRVAALMGVKPDFVISMTFVIGATLAAIAGIMWALNYGTVQHSMGFLPGLKAFTAAVFGGIGNLTGAMVGGVLLGLIEAIGAGYLGDLTGGVFGSQYVEIFAFLVLILVLTLRPSCLMGERVADRA